MNLQPVTHDRFGSKKFKKVTNFSFAAKDSAVEITVAEVPEAVIRSPIGFLLSENRYTLVSIQGLQSNKNLYVTQSGNWMGGYRPNIYSVYPFRFAIQEGTEASQRILCFDESSNLIVDSQYAEKMEAQDEEASLIQPFFTPSGEHSEILKKVTAFLVDHSKQALWTRQLCQSLHNLGLLKNWRLGWMDGEIAHTVDDVYCIDESALNGVGIQDLIEIRDSGALLLAYGQLFSQRNVNRLVALQKDQTNNNSGLAVFDEDYANGTLNFDNL